LAALSERVSVESATPPGLSHLFLSSTEVAGERHVAPEVIDAVARFMQQP
jgi:hypothetical protein